MLAKCSQCGGSLPLPVELAASNLLCLTCAASLKECVQLCDWPCCIVPAIKQGFNRGPWLCLNHYRIATEGAGWVSSKAEGDSLRDDLQRAIHIARLRLHYKL